MTQTPKQDVKQGVGIPPHAQRLDRLPPYQFALIGQRIIEMTGAGKDVIRLDIGSPDLPPPPHVIEALKASASQPGNHSYGNYRGEPAFRKAVAAYYQRRFGVELDPNREVLPLIGSKEGIVNMALAFLDRGDAAIVPALNYPAYSQGALMAGAGVIEMALDPARGYLPDFRALESDLARTALRPKLLWVNYPNNPTGAVASLAFYEEAVAFCRAHGLLLCSDAPYSEVVFDGYTSPSALQVPGAKECTVEFMSLSKTYNMAGWRLGAAVGRREALDKLLVIKSNMDSGHFKAVYDAGTAALNDTPDSWLAERNARYQRRRDQILATMPEIGVEAFKAPASLYVWARVHEGDDGRYAERALEGANVSIAPGSIYGAAGRGYVRFSLSVPEPRLEEALGRLRRWYNAQ